MPPVSRPRLLFLSLGGTITMVPDHSGGIAPKLGAALIGRGLVPAGFLSGLKARLLLGLCLRSGGGAEAARRAFAPYL